MGRAKKRREAKPSLPSPVVSSRAPLVPTFLAEGLGLLGLVGLFAYFLTVSWRKWPDPLIDFGRELYFPWRLAEGAVLYRDLEGHYGPLSQYFNSWVFRLTGPGLMHLVTANLVIFLGILALFYLLCRQAWGRLAAVAGCATYIAVFGFSQLTGISNYNYAAPYAHEVTHGIFISLALTFVLTRWASNPTMLRSLAAGSLLGICFVLKPEFILAGTLVTFTAVVFRWWHDPRPLLSALGVWIVGVILPTLGFVGYFSLYSSFPKAFAGAAGAWLHFVSHSTGAAAAGGIQGGFSGLASPGNQVAEHLIATSVAVGLILAILGIGWSMRRVANTYLKIALGLSGAIALSVLSAKVLNWLEVGRCLAGLLAIYLLVCVIRVKLEKPETFKLQRELTPLLLAVLGLGMMARMALNGRIYHYGFYQAAIAGCVLTAILAGEAPRRVGISKRDQWMVLLLVLGLLVPGVYRIAQSSHRLLSSKVTPIGEGADRFYAFGAGAEPTGAIVAAVTEALKGSNRTRTLVVLPEGMMLNYLARIPSPLPGFFYAATDEHLVGELEKQPPEGVILISRNLREYGIERYGEKPGGGQEIRQWLAEHYHQVAHIGGNPVDNRQRGAVFFRRK